MDLLPDEIIMTIFCRTSTLDFLRLRCVCKSWRKTIIDMESFFHQLEFSPSKPMNNQVLIMDDEDGDLCFVDLANKARDTGRKLTALKSCTGTRFNIIGSSDGILCLLSFDQRTILITNPFTNRKILLPELNFVSINRIYAYGFGYDAVAKLYKVVLEFRYLTFPSTWVLVWDSESTSWGCKKPSHLGDMVVDGCFKVFSNGRLHWFTWPDKNAIISFDLKDENFRSIRLPRSVINLSLYEDIVGYDLIVFRGCLCIFICYKYILNVRLQIWVMKEYGVEESWTMDHNFILPDLEVERDRITTIQVLGEVEKDKILLKCGPHKLLLIDPMRRNFEYLQHPNLLRNTTIHSVTLNWIVS